MSSHVIVPSKYKAELGIIGGTGLYDPDLFQGITEVKLVTPYGSPSHFVSVGQYNGRSIAFIPRHGSDHSIPPHKVNYRANIWALKELGVQRVISVSSVGSLQENLKPGDFVFPDQFIDRTKSRGDTFFDGAQVAHISSADPFCTQLRKHYLQAATRYGVTAHNAATYVCIEGPRFSTRAESKLFRQWGADIIGMTLYPECVLAREAQMCYACLAMVTDYDVWADRPVSASEVAHVMKRNVVNAKKIILDVITSLPDSRDCSCANALDGALL